jgi:hypothetical protein
MQRFSSAVSCYDRVVAVDSAIIYTWERKEATGRKRVISILDFLLRTRGYLAEVIQRTFTFHCQQMGITTDSLEMSGSTVKKCSPPTHPYEEGR